MVGFGWIRCFLMFVVWISVFGDFVICYVGWGGFFCGLLFYLEFVVRVGLFVVMCC
jgi:hypothetical protein